MNADSIHFDRIFRYLSLGEYMSRSTSWYGACLACLSTTSSIAVAQIRDQTKLLNSKSAASPIEFSQWITVYSPTLGNAALALAKGVRAGEKDPYYFLPPYFHYDLVAFQNNLAKACPTADRTNAVVNLPVRFWSKLVNDEATKGVKEAFPSTNLLPYPVGLLRLTTGATSPNDEIPTREQAVYPAGALESVDNGYLTPAVAFDFTEYSYPVRGTCLELNDIARGNDFQAYIYTQVPNTQMSYFSVEFKTFLKSEKLTDLLQDQKNTGTFEITTKARGKSVGLNLGGFFGAKSSTSDEEKLADRRGRWVSSNLLQSVVGAYDSSIAVVRISPKNSKAESGGIQKRLLDYVLTQSPAIVASFAKTQDGQWQLSDEHFGLLTMNRADVNQLLKSSVKPELNGTQKVAVKYAGVDASEDKTLTVKDERNIEWKKDGQDWVPVSAELRFVSRINLEGQLTASFDDIRFTGGTLLQKLGAVRVSKEFAGPAKSVLPLPAGIYTTRSYWDGGKVSAVTACMDDPQPAPGQTRIGAISGRSYDQRKAFFLGGGSEEARISRGCRPAGHCDGAGEFCVSTERSSGCIINDEWLAWFREHQRLASLPVKDDDICTVK